METDYNINVAAALNGVLSLTDKLLLQAQYVWMG